MIKREIIEINPPQDNALSVLQFNTLANKLSNSFPRCPPKFLDWEYRKNFLLKEILQYKPSIISLQEVDKYEYFRLQLAVHSYNGLYFHKPKGGVDGSALFVTNKYKILRYEMIEYYKFLKDDSSQVAIIAEIEISENKSIIFATTHLKAKPEFEEKREHQIQVLLEQIKLFNIDNNPNVIITGDLNTEPSGSVYPIIINAGYKSAYPVDSWTTYKYRLEEVCRNIDYIFYSVNLELNNILEIPDKQLIGINGLPNQFYPSDHMSLFATFSF